MVTKVFRFQFFFFSFQFLVGKLFSHLKLSLKWFAFLSHVLHTHTHTYNIRWWKKISICKSKREREREVISYPRAKGLKLARTCFFCTYVISITYCLHAYQNFLCLIEFISFSHHRFRFSYNKFSPTSYSIKQLRKTKKNHSYQFIHIRPGPEL